MVNVRQIQNSFFAVANYLITDDSADYCDCDFLVMDDAAGDGGK